MALETAVEKKRQTLDRVTIRFAGDSGDGMQLTGTQFTNTTALVGNDLATFPDYPAEIRAPAGSLPGVSGFQISFSSHDIRTPGDQPNVLVAMNPASLKVNLGELEAGGMLIVNEDAFTPSNLQKAAYAANPLENGSLSAYRVFKLPITSHTRRALEEVAIDGKEKDRCKNFFALGVMYWLYDRPLEPTERWIQGKFKKSPELVEANCKVLRAGYHLAETMEIFTTHFQVTRAPIEKGVYRNITGNEATALGLVTAAHKAGKKLFYGSYPITPASDILHQLSGLKAYDVATFQAEDEIAAICSAIGASYVGHVAVTGTSGPGVALKSEAIGLAVMTELPLVIIVVQRGGPSTGLPTKTEQADLFQAIWGRNGDCPVAVLAAATPRDCFDMAFEAVRLSLRHMLPVMLLTDGYLANGSEPWKVPLLDKLPSIDIQHPKTANTPEGFMPYLRDPATLARPWALPGTPGLEHRIGGLEKADITGAVSYDPDNHDHMVHLRQKKVDLIADDIPATQIQGASVQKGGKLLILGWGGTQGAIASAVEQLQQEHRSVGGVHLRYLNPLPKDLGDILRRFEKVLIPEINLGQLATVIRARYLVQTEGLNLVRGKPFKISAIVEKAKGLLS